MATATAAQTDQNPAPQVTGVVPYVQVSDCASAIELYKRAFGAEELGRTSLDGKTIIHAHLRINGGDVFLSDPCPEAGFAQTTPAGYVLHLQVDDPSAWFARAASELVVVMPLEVMFWGDTYGRLRDSFGVSWSVAGPTG